MQQNAFDKEKSAKQNRIEQIKEFELRGSDSSSRTCTLMNPLFSWQNKNLQSKKYLSDYLLQKILREDVLCFLHLGLVTYKI